MFLDVALLSRVRFWSLMRPYIKEERIEEKRTTKFYSEKRSDKEEFTLYFLVNDEHQFPKALKVVKSKLF